MTATDTTRSGRQPITARLARTGLTALLAAGLLLACPARLPAADSSPPVPADAADIHYDGITIGDILIENGNVFNLDDPREDKALYRAANWLHIRTKPRIIRRQLLFRPGDDYSGRLAEESERILRSNDYLANAQVEPLPRTDGKVDVRVKTTDAWTLIPRLDFGRSGGVNTGSIGFEEHNLAGTGVSLGLVHASGVDRDSDRISFRDRELGDTRYNLSASFADSDDGNSHRIDLGLPFYALDSHSSHGLMVLANDRIDTLYDRGDEQAEFHHDETGHRVYAGFSRGLRDSWVTRYYTGIAAEEHQFAPVTDSNRPETVLPEDREYVYPFFGVDILEDDFQVAVNHDQIGRVEDIHRGTRLGLQLGLARTAFGSLDNATLVAGNASRGFGDPGFDSLFTSANLSLRWQDSEAQNLLLDTTVGWHHRHSPRRMLYTGLHAMIGSELDLDNPIYLGGDTGLRGYPLRYQGGDRSLLFTVEERYFTNWYPFRLFRIGGAVFFDAGRTWGDNPVGAGNLGWLEDVGLGLRIGNNRSGTGNVIHIDLAFPLDRDEDVDDMQFLVEARSTF
jgi:hypothetical protein